MHHPEVLRLKTASAMLDILDLMELNAVPVRSGHIKALRDRLCAIVALQILFLRKLACYRLIACAMQGTVVALGDCVQSVIKAHTRSPQDLGSVMLARQGHTRLKMALDCVDPAPWGQYLCPAAKKKAIVNVSSTTITAKITVHAWSALHIRAQYLQASV